MVELQITYLFISLYFVFQMGVVMAKEINLNETGGNITETSLVTNQNISEHCKHKNEICQSNFTNICAMKVVNHRRDYQDFNNSCFLLMNNICGNEGEEYYIVTSGSCQEYFVSRRMQENQASKKVDTGLTTPTNAGKEHKSPRRLVPGAITTIKRLDSSQKRKRNSTAAILRAWSFSRKYKEELHFDGDICPMSCTNVYKPVCVNVNHKKGKHYRAYYFRNDCCAYVFFCKHPEEKKPDRDDEPESIQIGILTYTRCAHVRYVQFARFNEVISSLGSYGWLSGNYKYSHMLSPAQIKPGFG